MLGAIDDGDAGRAAEVRGEERGPRAVAAREVDELCVLSDGGADLRAARTQDVELAACEVVILGGGQTREESRADAVEHVARGKGLRRSRETCDDVRDLAPAARRGSTASPTSAFPSATWERGR